MPGGDVAHDTIAAVATPPGRGGIGIIRISGPRVPEIGQRVLGKLPAPRHAEFLRFRDSGGALIDEGIVLYFPGPGSYTGEPVLELHGHGGPVVLQAVLSACLDAGARVAEPGEFTRRAFLSGKLDLAQAEAVADLIDAASQAAARSAARSLAGELSAAVEELRTGLTELRALVEAMLDFPEEEIDALHVDQARQRLAALRARVAELQDRCRQGSLLRTGIRVVLAGRPNAGKSSLLNRLAGEERAIVTEVPGTTRDALYETIQVEGVPIVVVDTAGLREAADELERLGIARTQQELRRADVVLAVHDVTRDASIELDDAITPLDRIEVYNKIDLVPGMAARYEPEPTRRLWVSARTGEGIDLLRRALLESAGWRGSEETVYLARERHLRALDRARMALADAASVQAGWELLAEELRLADCALGEIIGGEHSAEALLGEIFGRFCIGK